MRIVTLGGVTFGAAILIIVGMKWWFREKHRISALAPFLISLGYGMLLILSGGGVLGWAAGLALWGGNGVGDLSLVWGVGGTTSNVTRARQLVLDPGGHVIVLLLTVVLVCLWAYAGKIPNKKIFMGIVCGICLGLSGTLAGYAAVPLGSGANLAGLAFTELLA
ncbi:hypothetical protein [Streptomyces sp. NBC_01262]|uniref:hypothetical protein n=1 Tax=Streptomyces sp. NBC_01262 TaxID=2903803 RepID=UPI002E338788|nr:hypothetical protein [Streptomyces sp. NBC_01262]